MKKLTTILAGLFLLFSASAFTTADVNVSNRVKKIFEQDFASASEVKWDKNKNVYIASFKVKDLHFTAAYSDEGELLGIARYIELSQLPLIVYRALENKYSGYSIDPSVEEVSADETSYFIIAENEKYKLKIKSNSLGNLSVVSKTKNK